MGARALSTFLLSSNQSVAAIVVMDMISWRKSKSDSIVQINAGRSTKSIDLASCFLFGVSTPLSPAYRSRWSPFSYLFNTDAVIFDEFGFPTLLVNEHINLKQNFDRPYYHQSSDTPNHINTWYGSQVARFVIKTVANL